VKGSGAVAIMRHTAAAIAVADMANMAAAAVKCTVMAADVIEVGQVAATGHVGTGHAGEGGGG